MKLKNLIALSFAVTFCSFGGLAHANKYNIDGMYAQIEEIGQPPLKVVKQYHKVYKAQIYNQWKQPIDSKGAYVRVRMFINPNGLVKAETIKVETLTDELRRSIIDAISTAQPFLLPTDRATASKARKFEGVFFVTK